MVLDDLHWIDSGTVDLMTRLLGSADLACLLLATARPEIDDRFPRLFAGLPSERIDLRPLSAKAAERRGGGNTVGRRPALIAPRSPLTTYWAMFNEKSSPSSGWFLGEAMTLTVK